MSELRSAARWLVERNALSPAAAEAFAAAPLPPTGGRALCHSDYQDGQCVVAGGHISAVVDWESAWAGNCLIDLAIARAHLEYAAPPALAGAFMTGYGERREVPPEHEQEYRVVVMATYLGLVRTWLAAGGEALADPRLQTRIRRAAELFAAHACVLG